MSAVKDEPRIVYMPVGELPPADRNPKRHDVEVIKGLIRRFGFVQPLLVNEATGKLVAGHGRKEALAEMMRAAESAPARIRVAKGGGWLVPVTRGVRFASEAEAQAYLLADNKSSESGGWDDGGVAEVLRSLPPQDAHGLGWDPGEVDEMLGRLQPPELEPAQSPSHSQNVKSVQLMFTVEQHDQFLKDVRVLAKKFEAVTTTDTVARALRELVG